MFLRRVLVASSEPRTQPEITWAKLEWRSERIEVFGMNIMTNFSMRPILLKRVDHRVTMTLTKKPSIKSSGISRKCWLSVLAVSANTLKICCLYRVSYTLSRKRKSLLMPYSVSFCWIAETDCECCLNSELPRTSKCMSSYNQRDPAQTLWQGLG